VVAVIARDPQVYSRIQIMQGLSMETDSDVVKQILDEFYPQLEALDTQCSALRQLLKDEGLATDEKLAPYLEQAGKRSSVKWLANRLRIEHLLSSLVKEPAESTQKPTEKPEKPPVETARPEPAEADGNQTLQKNAAESGTKEKDAGEHERKTAGASKPGEQREPAAA